MLTMHGRIQKILSGGLDVLRSLFYFFLFHRGQCGPDLPFEAIGPTGSYFFPRLSIAVFLRKHITTFYLPAGVQPSVPHPWDTRHMRCLANNLDSVARSVAYLLNMQADKRSHPAYFSRRIVSSPDVSRRPSCQ